MTRSGAAEAAAWGGGTLVIGYGNTLRRDDALGVLAAEAVESRGLPGVRVLTAFQLLPELAEPIASVRRVLFVDARVEEIGAGVRVARLESGGAGEASGLGWTHVASPSLLVEMAARVFGHRPEAWIVSISAFDLGYGEGLSDEARSNLGEAVERILELLKP